MKASLRQKYGLPDVIEIEEVNPPDFKHDEILVKVHAASVNRTDCGVLRAKPAIMQLFTGIGTPKRPVLGVDFAGEITAVGSGVDRFEVGDRVFGFDDNGGQFHAEYAAVKQNRAIGRIPDGVRYIDAAASIEGTHYANHFMNCVPNDHRRKVMVNGATGAIGAAAVQLLKIAGAEVWATCRGTHSALVQKLGAAQTIDYTQQDFTQCGETFDAVFDCVGKSTYGACKQIIKPGGYYLSSELGPWVQNPLLALMNPVCKHLGQRRQVKFPVPLDIQGSMNLVSELLGQQKLQFVIDKTYPLQESAAAFKYVLSESKVGNVILLIHSLNS